MALLTFLLFTGFVAFYAIWQLRRDKLDTIQKFNLVTRKGIEVYSLLIWLGGGAWSYVEAVFGNGKEDLINASPTSYLGTPHF